MKSRYLYIDYLKVIAMLLVIMYHASTFNNLFFSGIKSVGVPLFFFVNGFLMLQKDRKIKDVLFMMLKVLILYYVWGILKIYVYNYPDSDLNITILLNLVKCEAGYGYWFLLSLATLYILFPILRAIVSNRKLFKYLICVCLIGSISFIEVIFRKINPFVGWQSYSLLYYLLGFAVLSGYIGKSILSLPKYTFLYTFFVCMILQYFLNLSIDSIPLDIKEVMYLGDIVFSGYRSLFVVIATVSISVYFMKINLPYCKVIELIGKNTLGIYLLQDLMLRIMARFFDLNSYELIIPIIVLISCAFISYIISKNKFSNWFISTKMKL